MVMDDPSDMSSLENLVALNASSQARDPHTQRWVDSGAAPAAGEATAYEGWTPSTPVTRTGKTAGDLTGKVIETPGYGIARENVTITAGANRTYQSHRKLLVTKDTSKDGNHLVSGFIASSNGHLLYRVPRHNIGATQPVIIHGTGRKPAPKKDTGTQDSLF